MRIAYLDCNAGISGNMFLGALLDLGYPIETLKDELKKLPLSIPELKLERVSKKGIAASWFETIVTHEHHHRNLTQICNLIFQAGYSKSITDKAVGCFRILAEVEAKVHGVSIEEIHFHEVGAVDAIVDIVGACLGIEYFNLEQIYASPVRVGFGTAKCAHGEISLPAPAALELLTQFNVFGGDYEGEWTTPTGGVILKSFAKPLDSIPQLKLDRIGYGAGTDERPIANVHRILLGDLYQIDQQDYQVVLETNIDDLNPELYGFLGEVLLENGAWDYYLTPVYMKKGRPGVLVTVIVSEENVSTIEDLLFKETSTLGIRKRIVKRHCLDRDFQTIEFGGCKIKIKTALRNGKIVKFAPEYDECLLAARKLKLPVKEVYDEANFQFRKKIQHEGGR